MNKVKNKNPHATLSLNMFAHSVMWVMGAVTLLSFATPANAIIVCHDYALYRATGKDPRSKTSTENSGTGITEIRKILGDKGYKSYPITMSASENLKEAEKHLKPGDVIILRNDHSGFVNENGTIDHFIQVSDLTKTNRPVIKYNAWDLPRHRLPGKFGGLFLGDSLAEFLKRPFYKGPVGYLEVWRKEKNISGTWIVTQGSHRGTLTLTQSGISLSGAMDWDNHADAKVDSGSYVNGKVVIVLDYSSGLKGTYTAEVDALGTRMTGGTARSNRGTSAIWEGKKQ